MHASIYIHAHTYVYIYIIYTYTYTHVCILYIFRLMAEDTGPGFFMLSVVRRPSIHPRLVDRKRDSLREPFDRFNRSRDLIFDLRARVSRPQLDSAGKI